jgi:hypothetical protein
MIIDYYYNNKKFELFVKEKYMNGNYRFIINFYGFS